MITNIIILSTQLKWSGIGSDHQHYHFTHLVIRNIKSIYKQWSPTSLCCLYNKHQYHMCCLCNQFRVIKYTVRHRSQTLVWLAWLKNKTKQKKRGGEALKFLTLVRGALKKMTTNFPVKIEFTCLIKLRGWSVILMAKRERGGPEFFGIRPPLKVIVNGP